MSDMRSRPVQQTVVYRQDTKPKDTRGGVIWVDTSASGSPETKVYDASQGQFAPVVNIPLFVMDEAVTFGESNVNTSSGYSVYVDTADGEMRLADNRPTPWGPPGSSNTYSSGICFEFEPKIDITGLSGDIAGEITGLNEVYVQDTNGNKQGGDTNVSPGGTFNIDGVTFAAGTRYEVHVDLTDFSTDTQTYTGTSDPHDLEIWTAYNYNGGSYVRNVGNVTPNSGPTSGDGLVAWNNLPDDLAAWDRVSWQEIQADGSITADVEVNDGSGWSTFASDVAPPFSIAGVDPSTDVRLRFSFSRGSVTDSVPKIPYAARRGER